MFCRSCSRTALQALVWSLLALAALAGCSRAPAPEALQELEEQLQDVLTLHTAEHRYRSIVYFGEQRRFLFLDTMDRQVLFAIDLRVQAGIDLDGGIEIRPGSGDAAGELFVTLPPAAVMLVDADERSITEYFTTERGGSVQWLEYSREIENAKAKARERALEDGILDQAEENAAVLVRDFLRLADFEEVTVRVREREEDLRG